MADNVIALIPEQSPSAFEAFSSLKNQDFSSGTLYAATVVETDATGDLTVKDSYDPYQGAGVATGGLIGGLVGILAGPLGVLLGAGAGALAGSATDSSADDDISTALSLIAKKLGPNQTALLVVASEDDEKTLDDLGAAKSAAVIRMRAADVLDEVQELNDARDDEEYKQKAAERAVKRDERKAKNETAWNDFKAKFQKKDN